MDKKTENQTNSIKISEDVIAKIVEIAVKGVDGVTEFNKSKIKLENLFNKDDTNSAINVKSESGSVDITVNVIMSYSCKVKQAAEHIQNKVKNEVQNMTGIAVTKVNVIVDGIAFDNQ